MPTYQYACTECGHRFEAVQSFHEDSLTHCPECDGRLRKVFNAVGVVFKGSGFYRNDSRSGAASSSVRHSSKDSGSQDSGSSDSGSSDSGPRRRAGKSRLVVDTRGDARLVHPVVADAVGTLDPLLLVVLTLWRGRPPAAPVGLRSTACPTQRSLPGARPRGAPGSPGA